MPLANIDRSTPHLPKRDHSEARVYYVGITYSFMSVCRLQKWQTDAALYPLSSGTDLPRRTQKLHFSAPCLAGLRRSWLCVPRQWLRASQPPEAAPSAAAQPHWGVVVMLSQLPGKRTTLHQAGGSLWSRPSRFARDICTATRIRLCTNSVNNVGS